MTLKLLEAAKTAIAYRLKFGKIEKDPIFVTDVGKLAMRYDTIKIRCEDNFWGEKVFEVVLCLGAKELASMKSDAIQKMEGCVIHVSGLRGEMDVTIE
jgi:hypothetical protein